MFFLNMYLYIVKLLLLFWNIHYCGSMFWGFFLHYCNWKHWFISISKWSEFHHSLFVFDLFPSVTQVKISFSLHSDFFFWGASPHNRESLNNSFHPVSSKMCLRRSKMMPEQALWLLPETINVWGGRNILSIINRSQIFITVQRCFYLLELLNP